MTNENRRRESTQTLELMAGKAISHIAKHPTELHIIYGLVWITIAGEPHDHWLRNRESLTLPPNQKIVLEARGHTSQMMLSPEIHSETLPRFAKLRRLLQQIHLLARKLGSWPLFR